MTAKRIGRRCATHIGNWPVANIPLMLSGLLGLIACAVVAAAAQSLPAERYSARSLEDMRSVVEKFGIEIKSLRVSTAGYMLDFRHKVVDAAKASPLHSYSVKPYLWDPENNVSVVPPHTRIGILRQGKNDARDGRIYTTMFANPGRRFKPGDQVTLVLGDLVVEDMTIE